MPTYVATLRAFFDADDDASAMLIADKIAENAAVDLNDDEDSDDAVVLTQVTSNALELTGEESITQFRLTRNLLIKTRIKQCYEMAKELDKMIWVLEHRQEQGFDLANYDYTKFYEIADDILNRGMSPINS